MPRTVADGFSEFSKQLISKYTESDVAKDKLSIIERSLRTKFDMMYLATYGSTGHGTNENHYSAVDCFALSK